jgi:hypothetical protein
LKQKYEKLAAKKKTTTAKKTTTKKKASSSSKKTKSTTKTKKPAFGGYAIDFTRNRHLVDMLLTLQVVQKPLSKFLAKNQLHQVK